MTNISKNIFEGKMEDAKAYILRRLRSKLYDLVENTLYPDADGNSYEERIASLNEQLASLEENEENKEAIMAIKEEIQTIQDLANGLILESEGEDPERDAVNKIRIQARMMGAGDATYAEGVMYVEFRGKQAVSDFADWLESGADEVFGYEINVLHNDKIDGVESDVDVELDQITDDRDYFFGVTIYLNPELVQYNEYELEVDEDGNIVDENGELNEVVRKVKIDSRGNKTIKMKCARGFKWDVESKACVKITGAQLAKMRKSLRRAVLTKRSKGTAYRARVIRKTNKAKRFRKMMGLGV